ncbi:MAG: hypothetical protein Q9226_001520 [Calogaya cf. arnoldii]
MVGVRSIALLGMLAAAVTALPPTWKVKRQESNGVFIFRSDLREGDGQSPVFKNKLLSVNTTDNAITFIDMEDKDNASGGKVSGLNGVTLTTNYSGSVVTQTMSLGTAGNPSAPQPVVLSEQPTRNGDIYLSQNELRVARGSTTPTWDSWLICPDPSKGHPTLHWLAEVPKADGKGAVITKPDPEQTGCYIVRLFAETFQSNGEQSSCGQ